MDYNTLMENAPKFGQADTVAPNVMRVLAPNPSPMTHWGTNSFIIGGDHVALIDPGPDDNEHFDALLNALTDRTLEAILVTHSHVDHSPLARRLSDATKAPIYAYGNSQAGRSPLMESIMKNGVIGGGEGVDQDFNPTHILKDGDVITGTDWSVTSHWTPGHFCNHMSFAFEDILFCGDHLMEHATTMISPPDGDMSAFYDSNAKLKRLNINRYFPAHGHPIEDPIARIDAVMAHRQSREAQIIEMLGTSPQTPWEITQALYGDVDPRLHGAAMRNVLAHLLDLLTKNQVTHQGTLSDNAVFDLS
ncbi:MAG: MBL fold metallo-hydrolase [Halocynthiibacter sp.]